MGLTVIDSIIILIYFAIYFATIYQCFNYLILLDCSITLSHITGPVNKILVPKFLRNEKRVTIFIVIFIIVFTIEFLVPLYACKIYGVIDFVLITMTINICLLVYFVVSFLYLRKITTKEE